VIGRRGKRGKKVRPGRKKSRTKGKKGRMGKKGPVKNEKVNGKSSQLTCALTKGKKRARGGNSRVELGEKKTGGGGWMGP